MYHKSVVLNRFWSPFRLVFTGVKRSFSEALETKYTDLEKEKILKVINEANTEILSGYDIAKGRLKKFELWKKSNGQMKTISDIELVDGFTEKTTKKLFDSILEGRFDNTNGLSSRIKGQFLQPTLNDDVRENCKSVLSVYVSANSVCWSHINKSNYEVVEWKYYGISYPDSKRLQITDILETSWDILNRLPEADIYVMKAEATTLRAAGSDPNNPKIVAINLQKAQMVAMLVALINSRGHFSRECIEEDNESSLQNKVYFLRPTLPYRLYGTLVGNEKVSTDQTVEMILQNIQTRSHTHVYMSDRLQSQYRSQKELQKDMLGHCLLLALTFMDLCIYKNQESINKLLKQRQG